MDAVNDATSTSNGSIPGSAAAAVNGNMVPPFLGKTYDMVDDPKTNAIVSWSSGNNSFVVWNVPEFSKQLLPKYFKHNNFSSFVRQLNTYGFRKVDPDRWEFANEGFLRGQKHLLKNISRRKPSHLSNHQQQPKVQQTSAGLCVEVGKFGLDVEVEQLKRDKNVLMQELVRLRQQQQATDQQLQTVGQRVQVMEQRQQQMMSFLAKAMQSPGFLAQLVPQKSEGNRRIGAGNKKRRLPRQDDEGLSSDLAPAAFDGQIVKYQPSMNEAAISMLRQIMKINSTPRYENSRSKSNTFLIDDIPSSNALDSGNLSSRLTTNKVSQAEFPVSCPSDAISGTQTQTSPVVATEHGKANQFPEMSMQNSSENSALPDIPLPLGIVSSENDSRAPNLSFIGPENGKADVLRDGSLPMEANTCSPGPEMNNLMEGIPKLPSISDVFWEQFLTSIPLTEDTDEISSSCLDDSVLGDQFMELQQEDEWDRTRHMDHLTDQMGLLTSGNRRA